MSIEPATWRLAERRLETRVARMLNFLSAVLFCLTFVNFAVGDATTSVIDSFDYEDDAAAQRAWEPMRGSAPASIRMAAGRKALCLPCKFQTAVERASWDRQISIDLSSGTGIEFKILCRDVVPVSYFSIYFQSGDGWYHGTFFPESTTTWNTIAIDKTSMTSEGNPAGWARVKAIRVSAWRSQNKDTEFYLTDLSQVGVLGADATVAIVRCDSAAKRGAEETRNVDQFTGTVIQGLQALGIRTATVSDLDTRADPFKHASLVILPYNPTLPESSAEALSRYIRNGGKLLVFYLVPDRIRESLGLPEGKHVKAALQNSFSTIRFERNLLPGAPGIVAQNSWNIMPIQPAEGVCNLLAQWYDAEGRPTGFPAVLGSTNFIIMTHVMLPDDPVNKRRMLLAMAGYLVPDIWRQCAAAGVDRLGSLGGFASFQEANTGIKRLIAQADSARQDSVKRALSSAAGLRESAKRLMDERKFADSLDQSEAANGFLEEAFCLAQEPLPNEFRAFWCHSAFGVQGMDWEEAVSRLAKNGFTAVFPNMLWGGVSFYPSEVLPVSPQVASRGDQIAQCLAACRKNGIQVHVWKVCWNLGQAAPKQFVERLRRENRLQTSSSGKEEPWLCPSHPENQQLEIRSMVEVARKYPVDGIHFDYIRYPDADHCFCQGCKDRFCQQRGARVSTWPKDVLSDGSQRQQWLEWRRGNITSVVKAVSEQARTVNRNIKISAAVFPIWMTERDSIGQDWKLWCEKGYLDFVCPMDYTESNSRFDNMLRKQIDWAGKTPCFPGIGASASTSRFGVDKVINQINISRTQRTGGFVIFNYGVNESKELLPLLGLGITARISKN